MEVELSGWGRYPRVVCNVVRPEAQRDLRCDTRRTIARGQGRSYGDAAVNQDGEVVLTERLNRFLSFDENSGVLRAEAGVTIDEVLKTFVPMGWFPSVTPGTRFVSLAGCLATDVHGKNHHHDHSFSRYVYDFEMLVADGTRRQLSRTTHRKLFWATVGGMGLTGIIAELTMQLRRIETPYVIVQDCKARDLDHVLELMSDQTWNDQYTAAWIDCLASKGSLGRGVVSHGHHATCEELMKFNTEPPRVRERKGWRVPWNQPSWLMNSVTAHMFNTSYYHWKGHKNEPYVVAYDTFFYPLDRLLNWNKLYGKDGFVQYQCVLPSAESRDGLKELLEEIRGAHIPTMLAVLKRFGDSQGGLLSFPMAGYTLALDFPVGHPDVFSLLSALDLIVMRHGGRVYLAKDARLSPETFRVMYPQFPELLEVKSSVDPEGKFNSTMSRRLRMESCA